MIRILVCGGRDFGNVPRNKDHPNYQERLNEYIHIQRSLDRLSVERSEMYDPNDNWLPSDFHIIAGGATGADTAAIDWCVNNWVNFTEYHADWKVYGKRAGYLRNVRMLEEGRPDLVVFFSGGRGTQMMVDLARSAGVEVVGY